MERRDSHDTQERKILWLLEAAWPNWTPSPQLSKVSLQYGRAIHSLRGRGWLIENRVRIVDGVRHGEFRLGSATVPSAAPSKPKPDSLFPDMRERHNLG